MRARVTAMRSGLALALVMTLAVPPRPAHAGRWSTQQHAALDKITDLQTAGELAAAETLAVKEFADETAPPGFRRAVAKQGRAVAEALFVTTKDLKHLCIALAMTRVYQTDLIATDADRLAIPAELERLEALATTAAAPCARPAPPPVDPPAATPQPEGPAPPTAPTVATAPRRSRTQIGMGAGLLLAAAGLGAGFGGCFAARESEADLIRALDKRATEAQRDLTSGEWDDVHAADRRYSRLSDTGKALGVMAGVALVAAVAVLAMPPRTRSRARALGAGVLIKF